MDLFNNNKGKKKLKIILRRGNGGGKGKLPDKNQFWVNIVTTILIFFVLIGFYSLVTDNVSKDIQIPISQLATDITKGLVSDITVSGENLSIDYTNGEKKISKKEDTTALTQTLFNYGVPQTKLGNVKIEIKSDTGFGYWALNLAPIVITIIFIVL